MKNIIIKKTRSALIATALAMPNLAYSATFFDDFSTDTSADYIYASTFGKDTAEWNVSGGTLNMPETGGLATTANLFYDTATFGIGETVSVDISGPDDVYLSVSTTTRAANDTGQDGVRFNWMSNGQFRARSYTNGSETNTNFHSSFVVGSPSSLTLYLTRETDNTYSAAFAFDSGSGSVLTQLNTTGGTEKQIFNAGDTGNGDLFIGVETYNPGERNFDNLTVTAVPEPSAAALIGLGGIALILRRRK